MEGDSFVEILAHWDANALTDAHRREASRLSEELCGSVRRGKDLQRWRFWNWLSRMTTGKTEIRTVSFL